MVGHVRKCYDDAYKGFLGAGMSLDMAKQFSSQAANNEKISRRQVIESMYPTSANMIGEMADIKAGAGSVSNFTGGKWKIYQPSNSCLYLLSLRVCPPGPDHGVCPSPMPPSVCAPAPPH